VAVRLVARAVAAARPGPRCVTFDLTSDHHAEMYFVLTQALEDFAVRERDQAAWEEGNSSRERWADLADARRAQVEIARNGSGEAHEATAAARRSASDLNQASTSGVLRCMRCGTTSTPPRLRTTGSPTRVSFIPDWRHE
jgi:hypothetical protein